MAAGQVECDPLTVKVIAWRAWDSPMSLTVQIAMVVRTSAYFHSSVVCSIAFARSTTSAIFPYANASPGHEFIDLIEARRAYESGLRLAQAVETSLGALLDGKL